MTCAIVSAPHELRAFVTRNLAGHVLDLLTGGGRMYVLVRVDASASDLRFVDPFDGVLLVECKCFDDEATARAWAASDIALRAAETRGVQ